MIVASTIVAASLSATALFIRSEKSVVLEKELIYLGDYDYIFYIMDEMSSSAILDMESVSNSGYYYELGYAETDLYNKPYKVVSFPDANSEDIYHMTCIKGNYPNNSDEIAVDISFIDENNLSVDIGDSIDLNLLSNDDTKLNKQTFKICGIFRASNNDVYGGWNRYPSTIGEDEYEMPVIYVHQSQKDNFKSELKTVFIQTDSREEFMNEFGILNSEKSFVYKFMDEPSGRSYAFSYVLGIKNTIEEKYGEMNYSNVLRAINDGNIIKDFYSSILIPVYTFCLLIIAVCMIFNMYKIIVNDRIKYYGILRAIGLTSFKCDVYILFEIILISISASVIGMLIGLFVHFVLVFIVNFTVNSIDLPYGFSCSKYVKAVTYSPYLLPIVLVCSSALIAIFPFLIKIAKECPTKLLKGQLLTKDRIVRRNREKTKVIGKWFNVLNKKFSLHSSSVMIVITIVLSCDLFGYLYFKSLSDSETKKYKVQLQRIGITQSDYKACISNGVYEWAFGLMNHHDYGIDEEVVDNIISKSWVKSYYYEIYNQSTRITLKDNLLDDVLHNQNLRYQFDEESDGVFAKYYEEGSLVVARHIGYSDDEYIYRAPTLGLSDNELLKLNVVSGQINISNISTGKEIIIAVPEKYIDKVSAYFHIGDTLPLSDIVMNEKEEKIDFGYVSENDVDHIYDAYVEMEDGVEINVFASAFGKRKDIETKIGAIVSLNQEEEKKYAHNNPLIIICSDNETFKSWGLPDCKYTMFTFAVTDDAKINEINDYFYSSMKNCKGIQKFSSYEIREKIFSQNLEIMTLFYLIAFLLSTTGMIAIVINLFTLIKIKEREINIFRMIGMNTRQVFKLIISQNFYYPIIGALTGLIPVSICQGLFNFIKGKIESGEWEYGIYTDPANIPWYADLPFKYNLYDYGVINALLVCILIGFLLIIIGTIPQMLYIKNRKLIKSNR